MKKIVSGITPTGDLTIGNYIGAIKNFIELQNNYEMFIFVADLHALTTKRLKPNELRKKIKDIMALYIACGLDTKKVHLFVQSDIHEHANLGHILLTLTTLGELKRMTQFKSKSQAKANATNSIPSGLLTYPALMAADILLYNPNFVPVGKDQKQHIELTRNIAERFNNLFGKTFVVPDPIIKVGTKIMSLTDPTMKMSKSSPKEKSFIKLLDDPEKAYKKIMSAITDNENKVYFDPKNKPGVSNLLTIYINLKNISMAEAEKAMIDKNYKEFKIAVAVVVKDFLTNLQMKYQSALPRVDEIRSENKKSVSKIASKNYHLIKKKIGLF